MLLKDFQSKKSIKWVVKNPLVLVYEVNGMWQKTDFLMFLKDIQSKKIIIVSCKKSFDFVSRDECKKMNCTKSFEFTPRGELKYNKIKLK